MFGLLRIIPFVFVVLLVAGCRRSADKILSRPNSARDTELIKRLASLDQKLLPPRRGEWLSVHKEPGQTYGQYVASEPVRAIDSRNIIYILPIGSFTPYQDSVIQYTAEYLEVFFKLPVEVMKAQENDEIVAEGARNGDEGRQLFTTSILDYLKRIMPDDAIVIMALTATDLYAEPYNFVFGRGSMRERVGVSSMARFSTEPLIESNYVNCLERMIKTSSHEISHMFSMQHCINAVCVMNGSNSLDESDSRPNRLCSECHKKLQWNVGFDVVERVEGLREFFRKRGLVVDEYLMQDELRLVMEK